MPWNLAYRVTASAEGYLSACTVFFLFRHFIFVWRHTFFPPPENHVSSEDNYVSFFEKEKIASLLAPFLRASYPHFWGLAIPNNKHDYSGPHFFINFSNKIFLLSTFSRNFFSSFVPLLQQTFFHIFVDPSFNTHRQINQDRMIFGDFSVDSEPPIFY